MTWDEYYAQVRKVIGATSAANLAAWVKRSNGIMNLRVIWATSAVNLAAPARQTGNQLPEILMPVLKSLLSAMDIFQGRCEGKIFLSDSAMQHIWKGAHEDAVAFVWAHSSAHEECGLIRGLLEAMCIQNVCEQQCSTVSFPSLWQQWRPAMDAAQLYIDQHRGQR